MRFILTVVFCVTLGYAGYSQQRPHYRIKVEDRSGKMTRGDFYAASDDGLTLIRNRRDTLKLSADSIVALHVQRKGFVAPLAIAGGVAFFVFAAKSDKIAESLVLIVAGVPAGIAAGTFLGSAISTKKKYKALQAKDFPMIKDNLRQYTVLK